MRVVRGGGPAGSQKEWTVMTGLASVGPMNGQPRRWADAPHRGSSGPLGLAGRCGGGLIVQQVPGGQHIEAQQPTRYPVAGRDEHLPGRVGLRDVDDTVDLGPDRLRDRAGTGQGDVAPALEADLQAAVLAGR